MILWYVFGFGMAGTIGGLAATVHASGHAPVGLISLVVGFILGATMSGIAASLEITGMCRLLIGTILFALATAFAEHAWLYVESFQQWQQAVAAHPQAKLFRPTPPSVAEYFSHELTMERAALWSFDTLLIVANATATVFILQRKLLRRNGKPQSAVRNPAND